MNLKTINQKINEVGGNLYDVGGYVRDLLLGRQPKDRDFCVTGLTPEQFMTLFPDAFVAGKEAPVFRLRVADVFDENGNPSTCEFALARTEKKNGVGYRGFHFYTDPTLTIEDDLSRRDLTINAIAREVGTGDLIDPFGGVYDLERGILRHLSSAFAEDPLRVYRLARFASQFGFEIVGSTLLLTETLGKELSTISAERVYGELVKVFASTRPSLFFETLRRTRTLSIHFKALADLAETDFHLYKTSIEALDELARLHQRTEVLWGATVRFLTPNAYKELISTLKIPTTWSRAGTLTTTLYPQILDLQNQSLMWVSETLQAISRAELTYEEFALITDSIQKVNKHMQPYIDFLYLRDLWETLSTSIKGSDLVAEGVPSNEIGERLVRGRAELLSHDKIFKRFIANL